MEIVLARVDDRLIHGQVMTSWLNFTGANRIVVIDDVTANDPFLSMIIKSLVPTNIKTSVTTVEKSIDTLNKLKSDEKIIILSKTPAPYLHLLNNGIDLKKVNIGGMGSTINRKTLYRNIAASEEEIDMFRTLMNNNIVVEIQMVAEDPAIDLSKLI